MSKVLEFLNNKRGSFTILFIIITFIVAVVITGLIDLLTKTYILNEIQGVMDTSGASALQNGIDRTELRVEEFDANASYIETTFRNSVNNSVHTGGKITHFELMSVDVQRYDDTWGLGTPTHTRGYVMIDALARVRVQNSTIFDIFPSAQRMFYNSRSNGTFTVEYNGQTGDGEAELIVRSVNRLVYR